MSFARDVENHFKTRPGRTLRLKPLSVALRAEPDQVRQALSYLRERAKTGNAIDISVVTHGQAWRYNAPKLPELPEGLLVDPQATEIIKEIKSTKWNEAEIVDLVPKSEPTVTLRVVGTLAETGEVLVQSGDGDHFDSGVWAMRRLG